MVIRQTSKRPAHVAQELAVAEGLKIPYETAQSHYVLGKYVHTVKDRELHLHKAAEIFVQLGAAVDQMLIKST